MLTLHVDELLADAGKRKADIDAIQSRGRQIAALNDSRNPLDPGEVGAVGSKVEGQAAASVGAIVGVYTLFMREIIQNQSVTNDSRWTKFGWRVKIGDGWGIR